MRGCLVPKLELGNCLGGSCRFPDSITKLKLGSEELRNKPSFQASNSVTMLKIRI
jgi:hypothetical protein